jgi:coenzyme F420-dependent glucose-6-phosphate dehydrogenase
VRIGYKLCSEERDPIELVRDAKGAEAAGFELAAISDHFHPWTDTQGESPFVWGVLGAISQTTSRITVGTTVTCPTIRIHPAIVAQAAATAAALLPGRFFLGVGTGENLNEHIVGDGWPNATARRDMLAEAVDVIRELWSGEQVTFAGDYYAVDTARIYTLPENLPPIYVAAAGEEAARLAAELGDGLISTAPEESIVRIFREGAEAGAPVLGEMTVCYDEDADRALQTAFEHRPIPAIPGELSQELPLPRHFEQAASAVGPDDLRRKIVAGPDPDPYLEQLRVYAEAGFDTVVLHQAGTDQKAFLGFAADELLPRVNDELREAV